MACGAACTSLGAGSVRPRASTAGVAVASGRHLRPCQGREGPSVPGAWSVGHLDLPSCADGRPPDGLGVDASDGEEFHCKFVLAQGSWRAKLAHTLRAHPSPWVECMLVGSGSGRVTQAEVARLAGVSQAIVSLVVNGSDSVRVTPETRRRVEEALKATGYTVDLLGRRLRGKANRILGVFTYESVFPSGSGDFYLPFLGGIEAEAEALGYDLLLFTSNGRRDGRRHVYERGSNRLGIADGSILLGRHTDREELARLLEERFPFVFIGRRESEAGEVNYVSADYVTATAELFESLWVHGHRRVGLVALSGGLEGTADRIAGYLKAARRHRKQPIVVAAERPADEVLDDLLEAGVTGVLVETAAMAHALEVRAAARGLAVPGDISLGVLGDPDPSQAQFADAAAGTARRDWSMFRIPRREMGRRSVRTLVGLLESPGRRAPAQVLLPCELVEGSTIGDASRG